MAEKYIEYDGLLFCRDEKTGYYLNGTTGKRLHRYVWEKECGAIPDGYEIHHIDRDKGNNLIDNLCMLTHSGHKRMHSILDPLEATKEKRKENIKKAQAAAVDWHKSEAGRTWHSQKSIEMYKTMQEVPFTCINCGKEFLALPVGRHIYCSNACRSAARRKRGDDNETRICPICGKEFTANKYSETRFCSRKCMGINRSLINERKREAGEPVRKKK